MVILFQIQILFQYECIKCMVIIINYSHMYSHVVIILTIVIKMVETKNHIWLHDYVWTLIIRCPSHKNHILVFYNAYLHWCIMYKCSIQRFTYGGREWCQNFLFTKLKGKIINYGMYFCHIVFNLWQHYLILFHLPMGPLDHLRNWPLFIF